MSRKPAEKTDGKTAEEPTGGTVTETPMPVPTITPATVLGTDELVNVDLLSEFAENAGVGVSTDPADTLVPFLVILQKTSPAVDKRGSAYVEGAEEGMLLNTATRRLFTAEGADEGPRVIVAYHEVKEVEWIPRAQGGGFVASHPRSTPLLNEVREVEVAGEGEKPRKMRVLPNGHQLVTTAYWYLILADTLEPVVLGLTSTGFRTHRAWNTALARKKIRAGGQIFVPPCYASIFRLRSVYNTNDQGSWFTLSATDLGLVGEDDLPAYQAAKEFHQFAREGNARTVQPPSPEDEVSPTATVPSGDDDPDLAPI